MSHTGAQVWRFNTIPHPGEFGYETWPEQAYQTLGGANAWAGLTVDEERGLVFCPTGSATFDFYGGNRIGQNLFANTPSLAEPFAFPILVNSRSTPSFFTT